MSDSHFSLMFLDFILICTYINMLYSRYLAKILDRRSPEDILIILHYLNKPTIFILKFIKN